jgi:hypothetical protein
VGRYRTITKEVDVDIYISDLMEELEDDELIEELKKRKCDMRFMEELEDDELIEELKKRKCDMRFMDFSFPELDDSSFRERMEEMIYQVTTDRAKVINEVLQESYHYSFLKESK